MKLLSLHLRPFGPFADRLWNFAPEGCDEKGGLHLIFGPNGGGKSTTLRAVRSALFGMERGQDGHTFPSKDLRIAAHLRRADGDEIEYCRRTARKAWLWNNADDEALPEEQLLPFLGGLDRAGFETLYGLDLDTMQAGGRDLLEGEGDIGRALFGAALGGTRLATLLRNLKEESAKLFGSPKNSRINQCITERKAIERERNQNTRKHTAYDKSRKAWARGQKDVAGLRVKRDALLENARELEQKRGLVVPLAQLTRIREQLQAFGEQKPLAAEVLERFKALESDRGEANGGTARLQQSIRARTERTAALKSQLNSELLKAGERLRDLHGRVASYQEAVERLPELEERCSTARARTGSARLESKLVQNPAESLLVLERLATERRACRDATAAALKEHARAATDLGRATDTLEQLPAVFEIESHAELEKLALFGDSFSELSSNAPASQAVIATRQQLEEARQRHDDDEKRKHEDIDGRERAARADQVRLAEGPLGTPPSEADLDAARASRDGLWSELRASLDSGAVDAGHADALKGSIRAADDVADRLRRESDRALERVRIERELASLEASIVERARASAAVTTQRAAEDREWTEAWAASDVAPQAAHVMQGFVDARTALLAKYNDRLVQARAAEASAKAQAAERAGVLKQEESTREAVEVRWREWAERVGLDQETSEESAATNLRAVVTAGDAAEELGRLEPEVQRLQSRIRAFEDDARTLSEATGVALAETEGTDAERALAREGELRAAHDAATRKQAELKQSESEQVAEQDRLNRVSRRVQELAVELTLLRETCGTPDANDFDERVRSSSRLTSLQEQEQQQLASLLELAPGQSPEQLSANLDDACVESLDSDLELCHKEANAVREQLDVAQEQLGQLRREVEGEGSGAAAQLASRDASLLAEITDDTERYVKLELARHLLEREIEKHREEHQGPLLARAGELFQTLTLGTYTKLVPSELNGKMVMEAKRRTGAPVGIAGMSTGTQDQLYLALRIASVEQMIRRTEPMPFVADDLFVNFDDERTEAALKVLFELARSTQVIVFSHHKSVLESAHRLSERGVPIHVHELDSERERDDVTARTF